MDNKSRMLSEKKNKRVNSVDDKFCCCCEQTWKWERRWDRGGAAHQANQERLLARVE